MMEGLVQYWQKISELSNTSIVLVTILGLLTFIYVYYESKYNHIKREFNLQGPKPWPVFGNLLQYCRYSRQTLSLLWMRKYGKISIHFKGLVPFVVIGDREIVRQICTKDFEYMVNHKFRDHIEDEHLRDSLFYQNSQLWKIRRALMSPTFTSSKMRKMFKLMDVCADDLVDCIGEQLSAHEEKTGKPDSFVLPTKETFSLYTLDGIATCCYSIKIGRKKGEFSIYSSSARSNLVRELLPVFTFSLPRQIALMILPTFLQRFLTQDPQEFLTMASRINDIIENRVKNASKYDDLLQILLNSNSIDSINLTNEDESENHHVNHSKQTMIDEHEQMRKDVQSNGYNNDNAVSNKLSREELISNSIVFLATGLETTSISLAIISYCLAHHQSIQEKLYKSVAKIAIKNEKSDKYEFDHNLLSTNDYLDAVVSESLRLLSPATDTDRLVNIEYKINTPKYNTTLPVGTNVVIDIHAIHMDPDNWDEPEKFIPERFMPENRHKILPGSYTPFGQGPRHCLGMRFSIAETKVALAKIIMAYKFIPVVGSPFPPISIPNSSVHPVYKSLGVNVRRRN